jgi:hypothetical protein
MTDTPIPLPDDLNIDDDGYPDEAVLEQIRTADTIGTGARWMVETFPRLAETLPCSTCEVEDVQNIIGRPAKRIHFSTGGWSGCESFVEAVLGNVMLRVMYFYAWRRGGHHMFEVSVELLGGGANG